MSATVDRIGLLCFWVASACYWLSALAYWQLDHKPVRGVLAAALGCAFTVLAVLWTNERRTVNVNRCACGKEAGHDGKCNGGLDL